MNAAEWYIVGFIAWVVVGAAVAMLLGHWWLQR